MESSTKWALGIGGAAVVGMGVAYFALKHSKRPTQADRLWEATRPPGGLGHGKTGPGKFEGGMEALKRLLWTATLESWGDDDVTNENWGDGCVLVRGPLPLDELQKQFPEEYAGIDHEDRRELVKAKGGAIVCNDSQGFVDVDLFPTRKGLKRAWRRIQKGYGV